MTLHRDHTSGEKTIKSGHDPKNIDWYQATELEYLDAVERELESMQPGCTLKDLSGLYGLLVNAHRAGERPARVAQRHLQS